jgi:hypothetical protein
MKVKTAFLIALAITLAGCQTMQKYPKTTAFLATSIALSAYGATRDHGHSEELRMSTPLTPDCARYPELCR